MQVADLESRIHNILAAPGTNLGTISAKRVRRLLMEDPSVPPQLVKENKEEIDGLIAVVFQKVSEETGFVQEGEEEEADEQVPSRRRVAGSEEAGDDAEPPPKKKPRKSAKTEMTDEELAKMLSDELNGRPRSSRAGAAAPRGRGRGRGAKANGAKRGRKAKSAETVDSGDEGSDSAIVPKKKGGGFSKPYILSEPLSDLLQEQAMSRPQVVKGLWTYIKDNEMQNPKNKKEILCDDKFRAIFGTDKIDMFKMNKELGRHLSEPEAA
ncbi:SWIB-domain-containing protein [Artomyces pyxidatus]|uniref:SWIB-domain-containing protein n=1 Tax=Artomyces pyxidatus TaxID=48021 RepID=A0ACB8T2S9_9AGAM|nr:SWIB-domain-containing protein [Artomyces pyxidatus]